ncbi:MAG TPA: carboxypeptidase-like regulatory domain-containing protein, partial [Pyrinomonadaceae bacterium]|nr:carboxypeptidase-like regulatory domain-containing protein [Pyrinomonadaceae bacterium]
PSIPNGSCDGTDIGSVELVMPTAGEVSISGRVLTAKGAGISNVSVTVLNMAGDDVGTAVTNTFGYFMVGDLPAGASYVISVTSKGYVFEPSNQVVMLDGDMSDLNFVAKPTAKRGR